LANDRGIFGSSNYVCVVFVINPSGLELGGGIVEDYEIWAATFDTEDIDAEVFDRAVHIAKSVISGFKLRGSEHDLDQSVLDYFFSASAVFQDARGMGYEFTAVLSVESTKLRDGPDFQTCGGSLLE
jgi:hypothetical protein